MSSAAMYLTFWLCSPGTPCDVFVANEWLDPTPVENRKACVTEQLDGNRKLVPLHLPGSRYFRCMTMAEIKATPLIKY